MRQIVYLTFAIFLTCNFTIAQGSISCSIVFFDSVMVGQPTFFTYELYNTGTREQSIFYDQRGDNFNNLDRDESFKVEVFDSTGSKIQLREATPDGLIMGSKRVGFRELKKDKPLVYRHWINQWVTLNRSGRYELKISKDIRFKLENGVINNQTIGCSTHFEVIPSDTVKLANQIRTLLASLEGGKTYLSRRTNLELLCRLNTEMIIPHLNKIISTSHEPMAISLAMSGLAKFVDNEHAFNAITKVFTYDKNRFRNSVTRQNILKEILNGVKLSSLYHLTKFDDSLVIPFLLKQQSHEYPSIHLFVMQQLYRKDKKLVLELIKKNLNDPDQTVRSEAEMLLGFIESSEKE